VVRLLGEDDLVQGWRRHGSCVGGISFKGWMSDGLVIDHRHFNGLG
jgi:hypothetical protein